MGLTNMDYFKNIGKLLNVIHTYKDYDRALREGAKILLESSEADYVSLWYKRKKDSDEIYPYYWICPVDLTGVRYNVGSECVGICYKDKKTIYHFNAGTEKLEEETIPIGDCDEIEK